jgi:hypothetical protein
MMPKGPSLREGPVYQKSLKKKFLNQLLFF